APLVAVIGGGPAGLMAAETVAGAGLPVALFDAMPSVGRKFLLAGVGGMNITHSESAERFISRDREAAPWVAGWLEQLDAPAQRQCNHDLGIGASVGCAARLCPPQMKPAPLLRAWLKRPRDAGGQLHTRHRWLGWGEQQSLMFDTPAGHQRVQADAVILALGG